MVFSSTVFLFAFLPMVFLIYLLLPGIKAKNAFLVLASLCFYAYGEPKAVLLMIANTLLNWAVALWLGRVKRPRVLLGIAVGLNLGMLFLFKYLGFFCQIWIDLFRLPVVAPQVHLPIGISFFTFQALSYVIDVYRGTVKVQKSYGKVLLYIAFFPQLIAGPIVKYHEIEQQIENRPLLAENCARGLRRFTCGLAKKLLIANTMAAVADSLFAASPELISLPAAWLAGIAYTFQIYFDFSGYSDMAIGLGKLFGFTIPENFDYPLAADNMRSFWRRWHISLTTWFREYLYIPLGGNRRGRRRKDLNTMLVFAFTGLWHGANFTFLLWGMFHGLLLLLEDHGVLPVQKCRVAALRHLYTFAAVTVLFTLFRADTVRQAGFFIGKMFFTGWQFDAVQTSQFLSYFTPRFLFMLLVAAVLCMPKAHLLWEKICGLRSNFGLVLRAASYVGTFCLLMVCILNLSGASYNPFIYFRF